MVKINIQKADSDVADDIWEIFKSVVSTGDTYTFNPDIGKAEALKYCMAKDKYCYTAAVGNEIVGTYIIKNNQDFLGTHIANASFMVSKKARGKSIGKLMGQHALEEAKNLGYKAMQFNFVVSTNISAIKLWKSLGFRIIGTTPEAFQHQPLGKLVDAHTMYRKL